MSPEHLVCACLLHPLDKDRSNSQSPFRDLQACDRVTATEF